MDTVSLWEAITPPGKQYDALKGDLQVDVAIVGGGITGITTALQLIQAGKSVAILEANTIGSGTTGFSTGNLYVAVQPYFQSIVSKFNLTTATSIAHSRQYAIDYIEKIVTENKIDCHFTRRPWYLFTNEESELASLTKEMETFKKMNFPVEVVAEMPIALPYKKAFRLPNQARLNPLAYVRALANVLSDKGVQIFENTRVQDTHETKNAVILTTAHGKITAKQAVIATHTPIGFNLSQLFTAPYRSYVVAVELSDHQYPDGNFWDMGTSHHALSTHSISAAQPELLMVAGRHHKTGQGGNMAAHYVQLEQYLREHFPVSKVAYQWSAQHYQSADDLPYIGLASRLAKRTYIATGYFADGLVYGTVAGIILGDMMLAKENSMEETYYSNRFTPIASCTFLLKENSNVFMEYLKRFSIPKQSGYDTVGVGEGKVMEVNNKKVAVCRDEKNNLHVVSAICTHMQCVVDWNNAEKTWDCPCHGSRFTKEGKVIEGPATEDLAPV